jgi:hypothetical protein
VHCDSVPHGVCVLCIEFVQSKLDHEVAELSPKASAWDEVEAEHVRKEREAEEQRKCECIAAVELEVQLEREAEEVERKRKEAEVVACCEAVSDVLLTVCSGRL